VILEFFVSDPTHKKKRKNNNRKQPNRHHIWPLGASNMSSIHNSMNIIGVDLIHQIKLKEVFKCCELEQEAIHNVHRARNKKKTY